MAAARLLPAVSVPGADLPVRPVLPELLDALGRHGTAVLIAPPGSGKTSLLPLALADAFTGRIIVAEPRRLATRAAAIRLAALIGERPGGRIGYAMRGERVAGSRIEVVTTGLLLARLHREPDLPGVAAVVLDECHERHLDADLALAFCVDIRATLREELALVVTSATPDVQAMTRVLSAATTAGPTSESPVVPVVSASARPFEVEVIWAPPPRPTPLLADFRVDPRLLDHVADTVRRALAEGSGDVLVFVPGEAEIAAVTRRLDGVARVLPLFGRQGAADQERALTRADGRRVVVTTSVAESSLTVPGVSAVVDSGLARQPWTDQARGLAALVTTRVSRASADQRAGRAGREGPGRVYRCWSATDQAHLAAHTPPEIVTADLAGFALSVAAWGTPGGEGLALLDRPPAAALSAATALLYTLGALDGSGRLTGRGRSMALIGAHPRLARALLDGTALVGPSRASEVVALLSDGSLAGRDDDLPARWRALRTGRDRDTDRWREEVRRLRASMDAGHTSPPVGAHTRRTVGAHTSPVAAGAHISPPATDDEAVGTLVALAFPDRIARVRRPGAATYQLSVGTGAELRADSVLRGREWLAVAVADRPAGRADARISSAAPIDETIARAVAGDLVRSIEEIRWSDGTVLARRVESLGGIRLSESPITDPDPSAVQAAVRDGLRRSGLSAVRFSDAAGALRSRMAFCHAVLGPPWPAVDDGSLLAALDDWLGPELARVRRARDLARIDLTAALRRLLPWPAAARLEELAPERLAVPSGSSVAVRYDGAEPPVVAVKLQEVFGWTNTPTLADGRARVVLELLSPAGRPVAITADLASFWEHGYPQVRGELRARYPRHPWPADPVAATATRRTRPRG